MWRNSMENQSCRKIPAKWLAVLLVVLLMAAMTFAGCSGSKQDTPTAEKSGQMVSNPAQETEATEEVLSVPLATKYIVLSYPAELEGKVTVAYEDVKDGQKITFTTNIGGEELELFHFSISASGDDGYLLGTLEDEKAGSLLVCTSVQDYANGNWKPEDYNKINSMQERVNDIIVQFYADSRFTPSR